MARSPLRGPEGRALKNKLVSAGDVPQAQVFCRRANKDQIIVLRVVEREQASALDPYLTVQLGKNLVKVVNREYFSHAGVMVENRLPRIACRIEVAQAGLRASDKCPVAEDHPWGVGSGAKGMPEHTKNRLARSRRRSKTGWT